MSPTSLPIDPVDHRAEADRLMREHSLGGTATEHLLAERLPTKGDPCPCGCPRTVEPKPHMHFWKRPQNVTSRVEVCDCGAARRATDPEHDPCPCGCRRDVEPKPAHRAPCVAGEHCGEAAHCPSEPTTCAAPSPKTGEPCLRLLGHVRYAPQHWGRADDDVWTEPESESVTVTLPRDVVEVQTWHAVAEALRDQAPMFPRTARLLDALADALADANTPPEATSAPLTALGRSAHSWVPKGLREHLCQQQTFSPDERTRWAIQMLIDLIDTHRPVGPDGKHGDRHTDTCGCEDR